MNFLFYHLRRLVTFPIRAITSPGEAIGNAWSESRRNRSLILGLPALIIAGVAVAAIGSVQLVSQAYLEDDYDFRYQKTTADLGQLSKELARTQNVQAIGSAGQKVISDEDKQKLQELRDAQEIFLDKLISLDPENNEYRFNLAKLVASRNDKAHAYSILTELAPEDKPGYYVAHFVLAKNFFDKPARNQMELSGNLDVALKHINHVLTRDDKNSDAKLLKARILTKIQRYPEAYDLYEELFELNPNFYREMTELNRRMGKNRARSVAF